jgi:hypothetical protein
VSNNQKDAKMFFLQKSFSCNDLLCKILSFFSGEIKRIAIAADSVVLCHCAPLTPPKEYFYEVFGKKDFLTMFGKAI